MLNDIIGTILAIAMSIGGALGGLADFLTPGPATSAPTFAQQPPPSLPGNIDPFHAEPASEPHVATLPQNSEPASLFEIIGRTGRNRRNNPASSRHRPRHKHRNSIHYRTGRRRRHHAGTTCRSAQRPIRPIQPATLFPAITFNLLLGSRRNNSGEHGNIRAKSED